ncbi:MAG: RyR domain-containing protein [Anaerolineales bacterium]
MTSKSSSPRTILISGDITIDWNIAHIGQSSDGAPQTWNPNSWTRAYSQRGGAALIADLIEAVAQIKAADTQARHKILSSTPFPDQIFPSDPQFHHSYSLWSLYKSPTGKAWRVENFLGLDLGGSSNLPAGDTLSSQIADEPLEADLIVLDDANLGFRDQPALWPKALTATGKTPWIVVKMASPIAQGPLWDHLLKNHADRLVVILTANDLRLTEVQISQGLSWERTAQDVAWELVHNPRVNSLARCAYVVLSFYTEGAALLSRPDPSGENQPSPLATQCRLFFDPEAIEGTWIQNHPGGMIGYTSCLTAGLVYQLMISEDHPDIPLGIQTGFSALRQLHLNGYEGEPAPGEKFAVRFPIQNIARVLTGTAKPLADVKVQDPVRSLVQAGQTQQSKFWTILHDRHQHDLDQVAEQTVLEGIETALPDVPFGKFGHLVTVDRQEIESFRAICTLVDEYLQQDRPKRPLSIGVFGAPGSGKSFGITQVAKSLAPGKIEKLEFNLSQMNTIDELPDALHQVRDVNLDGKIPLVFWDEFDTSLGDKTLGWLRYFLAPMQDGAFREEQITHPIGRSIFVFAGGTSHTMADFGKGLSTEEARAAKVPDFVSRLKGYVNVLGPNPQQGEDDPHTIIRRAILLRSILLLNQPDLFQDNKLNIDQGVLRAFLHISNYKHGVRSIETILTMSQLSSKTRFSRSSLPSESQLDLHVNGQEFLALVQQVNLEGELLEKLASIHHQIFCQKMEEKGYKYGPITNDDGKTHSALLPWEDLPEDEKEQNRSAVRDIPHKLGRIGYVMLPARSNEPAEFPKGEDDLERLSIMEHERWMNSKLKAGWKYAPETNKSMKQHSALIPWEDLPEAEKDKDRDLVRAIPRLLTEIGYTVADLNDEGKDS